MGNLLCGLSIFSLLIVPTVILFRVLHKLFEKEEEEGTLLIQSSAKGYLGAFINSLLSAYFFTFVLFLLASYFKYVYAKYGAIFPTGGDDRCVLFAMSSGLGIVITIPIIPTTLLTYLETLAILIYGPLETFTFRKIEQGSRLSVTEEKCVFPAQRETSERTFDEVTGYDMHQSTIDKMMGTGTICVRVITYTFKDSFSGCITLRGIDDLFAKKSKIEKFLKK